MLSLNPNAIDLLRDAPHKIEWFGLSSNPNAIDLLKDAPHKIEWRWLSQNLNAIDLLRDNPHKINWYWFSQNPSIFTYDYQNMICIFKEELMAAVFHPSRFERYLLEYDFDMTDL